MKKFILVIFCSIMSVTVHASWSPTYKGFVQKDTPAEWRKILDMDDYTILCDKDGENIAYEMIYHYSMCSDYNWPSPETDYIDISSTEWRTLQYINEEIHPDKKEEARKKYAEWRKNEMTKVCKKWIKKCKKGIRREANKRAGG